MSAAEDALGSESNSARESAVGPSSRPTGLPEAQRDIAGSTSRSIRILLALCAALAHSFHARRAQIPVARGDFFEDDPEVAFREARGFVNGARHLSAMAAFLPSGSLAIASVTIRMLTNGMSTLLWLLL